MTLTKARITEALNEQTNLPAKESAELLESMLEIMKDTLANGENLLISRFGKFCLNEKSARKGRNPATGEEMLLDKRKVVTFKCSATLRDLVNS